MTANDAAESKPLPGTIFTPRQVRNLKFVVIAMGVALIGGFVLLVSAIVYQAMQLGTTSVTEPPAPVPPAAEQQLQLSLPARAEVSRLALDGDRMALHVTSPQGAEIIIFDLLSGRVLSRVRLRSE